jgi:hypothetical protein
MNRDNIKKMFENMGSRLTIRTGTSSRGDRSPLQINVSKDRHGEHFTLTLNPLLDESKVVIQALDTDKKLRQMLLNLVYWTIPEEPVPVSRRRLVKGWETRPTTRNNKPVKVVEKLLVGHDEMHWFVAGVSGANNIREAFQRLKPAAVIVAARNAGVKNKDWFKRKTKGFLTQGEWFFVPVHFQENKLTVIHKNEPISRQGGSPHIVEELVRSGGETVYVKGQSVITEKEYQKLAVKTGYVQRARGARVLGRGTVKHRDHRTRILKGWHEIHLSTELQASGRGGFSGANAFID